MSDDVNRKKDEKGKKDLKIHIPGLKWILPDNGNLSYYPQDGLTVIIYGVPGSGKTQLALQMSMSAAMFNHKNVIYLTKEAMPESLIQRIVYDFRMFDLSKKYQIKTKDDKGKRNWCESLALLDLIQDKKGKIKYDIEALLNFKEMIRFGRTTSKPDIIHNDCLPEHFLRFMVLERISEIVNKNAVVRKEIEENIIKYMDPGLGNNVFAFGNLQTPGFSGGILDRYSDPNAASLVALSRFCPDLSMLLHGIDKVHVGTVTGKLNDSANIIYECLKKTLLDETDLDKIGQELEKYEESTVERIELDNFNNKLGVKRSWTNELVAVCDSLSPEVLEECIRSRRVAQQEQKDNKQAQAYELPKLPPVWIFVLDTPHIPETMLGAYPPDIQIELGREKHAKNTYIRNIQIHKARHQRDNSEKFSFHIFPGYPKETNTESFCEFVDISSYKPGINIFPSLSQNPDPISSVELGRFQSWYTRIGPLVDDKMTFETHLGHGCTLLFTENQCHSMYFGLHYLLYQLAKKDYFEGDVLYICMDGGIGGALRAIAEAKDLNVIIPIEKYLSKELDLFSVKKVELYEEIKSIVSQYKKHFNEVAEAIKLINSGKERKKNKLQNEIRYTFYKIEDLLKEIFQNERIITEIKQLKKPKSAFEVPLNLYEMGLKKDDTEEFKKQIDIMGLKKDDTEEFKKQVTNLVGNIEKLCEKLLNEKDSQEKRSQDLLKSKNLLDVLVEVIELKEKNKKKHVPYIFRLSDQPVKKEGEKSVKNIYLLAPQFEWKPADEILDNIRRVLDGETSVGPNKICRVLFNRVGQIQSRWPLIDKDTIETFISNIRAMCWKRSIDIMIIDDTAEQMGTKGNVYSRWINLADNLIRLSRAVIHGARTVAVEALRTRGRTIKHNRPLELWFGIDPDSEKGKSVLKICDTFRGYTGIFTDNPKHCKIKLTLPYDREESFLQAEVMHIKSTLEMLFDQQDVEVKTLGPNQRTGMNSALAHLANLTHETCHVTAVDEIWLSQLLGIKQENAKEQREPALSPFSSLDLERALPDHVFKENETEKKNISIDELGKHYVTRALTLAQKRAKIKIDLYAIPYYNNWGVFVVNNLNPDVNVNGKKISELPILNALLFDRTQTSSAAVKKIAGLFKDEDKKNLKNDDAIDAERIVTWQDLLEAKNQWDKEVKKLDLKDSYWKMGGHQFTLDFFSFDFTMQEGVVCFFLELLLSNSDKESSSKKLSIFEDQIDTPFLRFNIPSDNRSDYEKMAIHTSFMEALNLIYNLLSHRQRRLLGYGKPQITSLDEKKESLKKCDSAQKPTEYSLFAREWITAIRPIDTDTDVLEKHILRHLPVWNGKENLLFKSITGKVKKSEDNEKELENACYGRGPTVSGTWYLGALRGGNIDLAADVIHELVSEERELERIHTGKGAPVSEQFYKKLKGMKDSENSMTSSEFCDFPYTKIIRLVHELNGDSTKTENIFPFCRLQIDNYPLISSELYDMVRHVMRLPDHLAIGDREGAIKAIVTRSLIRINKVTQQGETNQGSSI